MSGLFILLAGISFVAGFFGFTCARGCLLRASRMVEKDGEDIGPGKLAFAKLAKIDPRLARHYRIGMAVWLTSAICCIGFSLAAFFAR